MDGNSLYVLYIKETVSEVMQIRMPFRQMLK